MIKYLRILSCLFVITGCSDKILDTEAPIISIKSPNNMTAVWDSINIECEASDNNSIKFLQLWVDGKPKEKIYNGPYLFKLYVNSYGHNSFIKLKVLAYDKNGNGCFSETITVKVDHYLESKILYISPYYSDYQDLYLMDVNGQNKRRITHQMNINAPAFFSTDGKKITFFNTDDGKIYIVDADGYNLRSLFQDRRAYFARLSSVNNLLYYDHKEDDGLSSLYFYDISRNIKIKIIDHWNDIEDLAISPDGERIFCIAKNRSVFLIDWDGKNRREIQSGHCHYPISFSADGAKILYSINADSGRYIYTASSNGSDITPVVAKDLNPYFPAFSPEGGKIVFATGPMASTKSLCLVNSDGTDLTTIFSSTDHYIFYPQFTDNGLKIIFEMNSAIYSINIDGSGLKKLVDNASYPQLKPYSRLLQ